MRPGKQQVKPWISLAVAILILVFCILNPLWLLEYRFREVVHQRPRNASCEIIIFGIDENTLAQFGPLHTWNRQKVAQAIDILNSNDNYRPSVIALTFNYSEPEAAHDAYLLQALRNAGNVVITSWAHSDENHTILRRGQDIAGHILPLEIFRPYVQHGSYNMLMDRDGVIRIALLAKPFQDQNIYSLAVTVAAMYTGYEKIEITGGRSNSVIQYVGEPNTFYRYSFVDIFSPTFDPALFAGKIILIGPWAADLSDNFAIPIYHGVTMRGIEIHANIIQMLLEGRLVQDVSEFSVIVIVVLILLIGMLIGEFIDVRAVLAIYALAGFAYYGLSVHLFDHSHMLPLLSPLMVFVMLCIYQFAYYNISLAAERSRIRSSFKKYLDPQLASAIMADRSVDTDAVGKKRNIAVMFADVRGFTQMAEALRETPELVVEILNNFLELTTSCIFAHDGSVDKFIGDATMGVFNGFAPQEDYIYSAVRAAWDIVQKSEAVAAPVNERLGISLAFGIGIHCGDAIVGNLGPSYRKDYTAIGDMVNIAQRLESNASRSEILISKDVYDALEGRIEAESVGEMLLKGRSGSVEVFALQGFV